MPQGQQSLEEFTKEQLIDLILRRDRYIATQEGKFKDLDRQYANEKQKVYQLQNALESARAWIKELILEVDRLEDE